MLKVEQALKSLVSWLAATLEENYQKLKIFSIIQLFTTLDLDHFLGSMLLQKEQNLCQRVQYILCLQYNKQWYQIVN